MEWNNETSIFILIVYYGVPALIVGLLIVGFIFLIKYLIRSRNK